MPNFYGSNIINYWSNILLHSITYKKKSHLKMTFVTFYFAIFSKFSHIDFLNFTFFISQNYLATKVCKSLLTNNFLILFPLQLWNVVPFALIKKLCLCLHQRLFPVDHLSLIVNKYNTNQNSPKF